LRRAVACSLSIVDSLGSWRRTTERRPESAWLETACGLIRRGASLRDWPVSGAVSAADATTGTLIEAPVFAAKVSASSHPLPERSPLAGEYKSSRRNDGGCQIPTALQFAVVATGSASEPFGYGAEEPPAFCPRTHAAMIFQSGSSWDVNCLPPWWVSAMPPTSGASGISSNRLVSGLPGVTSFETI
jgi:hypothetical protein